ncbi:MAG: hypothetical protein IH892_01745 [Planctomycetes bacterium]|nr:hypothetical protein [Planctomycetota bacterium]
MARRRWQAYLKPTRVRCLLGLLLGSVALNIWQADQRVPVPPTAGASISGIDPSLAGKDVFRVATYNVCRGKGTDGIEDLSRAARLLGDCDIVGINELAGPSVWGEPNQAEQLGNHLEMGWLYGPNQRRWYRDHFGNGLLSRFDVSAWYNEPILKGSSLRNLITAHLVVNQKTIVLLITHLDAEQNRDWQLRHVLEEFQRYPTAILLGDFNATAGHPLLQDLLRDSGTIDAVQVALGPNDRDDRIDWIILRGLEVVAGGREPVGISDHPCLWVDVKFPDPSVGADG